ncbi:sialate O-acetylesterase [Paludisphaera borealis]|uniref:Putative carbohydrate esterase (Sialic acid-specific acetylesterase) n=1 Tax=Paludisphaera borealis TaxID=1387353 RepID=A0A1U7CIY7_9BACT|nr:sialate O-acetylesterase [Paludisphaera borealis]APW58866.1 putative carbohydrate esterase (sialic acid-specific acetylesterase) [Paludisphaera borealis]
MLRDSQLHGWRGPIRGLVVALAATATVGSARADVKLPAIFSDHMVLQRDQKDRVWGWAEPGEDVTVRILDQSKTAKAGADGKWQVVLDPIPTGGPYELVVQGKNTITFKDVLSGEVWICSGQSNMQMHVGGSDDADLEIPAAKYPQIRLITVPNRGTQEPQNDFHGKWQPCSPETVGGFSAVGYFFGRQLHETLGVPIGLINDSWGGSACEAWVPRERLAADPKYKDLLAAWEEREKNYPVAKKAFETYQAEAAKAKAEGKPEPKKVENPDGLMHGNHRPGNIFNGVLLPTIGYGIRGAIWYQGESNAGRAYQYRDLFPLMIQTWRELWAQGDFPFYWVQLADFYDEKPEPGDSTWAELREAQTMTLKLPKTGEAVIIDIGEGKDIHPRNKQGVGKRLARWALARDYGVGVACQSPTYKSMEKKDGKVVLTFDHVAGGFRPFDVAAPRGFTIAGADRKFVKAEAKVVGPDKIEVWSSSVAEPASVRYAWADNPVCNLYSGVGLPTTPFRTDDWPGVTVNNTR